MPGRLGHPCFPPSITSSGVHVTPGSKPPNPRSPPNHEQIATSPQTTTESPSLSEAGPLRWPSHDRVPAVSAALLHLSNLGSEPDGRVETLANPGIGEAVGGPELTAGADDDRRCRATPPFSRSGSAPALPPRCGGDGR